MRECPRYSEKQLAQGFRVPEGDSLEAIKTINRWSAPGDNSKIWYWGDTKEDPSEAIGEAEKREVIGGEETSRYLRTLCYEALAQADAQLLFGTGESREKLLIGVSCVEDGFPTEEDFEKLSLINPPQTIEKLRKDDEQFRPLWKALIWPPGK